MSRDSSTRWTSGLSTDFGSSPKGWSKKRDRVTPVWDRRTGEEVDLLTVQIFPETTVQSLLPGTVCTRLTRVAVSVVTVSGQTTGTGGSVGHSPGRPTVRRTRSGRVYLSEPSGPLPYPPTPVFTSEIAIRPSESPRHFTRKLSQNLIGNRYCRRRVPRNSYGNSLEDTDTPPLFGSVR